MSDRVQAELIKTFFPNTREEWRKHYGASHSGGPKMTRLEHISSALVGLGPHGQIPVGPVGYEYLYGHLVGKPCPVHGHFGEMGFKVYPTWEELVVKLKPWLANDEEFAKWQTLEPFDRFRLLVCGLPWDDEVLEMLKHDDGPKTSP